MADYINPKTIMIAYAAFGLLYAMLHVAKEKSVIIDEWKHSSIDYTAENVESNLFSVKKFISKTLSITIQVSFIALIWPIMLGIRLTQTRKGSRPQESQDTIF